MRSRESFSLDQDKETQPLKEKSLKVPGVIGKKLNDVDEEEEDDKIKAWKGADKKETKVVTILQEKEAGP